MGAAQYDGRPSPVFAARLDHAIELYRAGLAPRLIVTGGKADGDRTTEAATGRAYAIARGVPRDAILVEDQSRTTFASIRAVRDVLRDHGLKDAIFVSDRPHMLRVLRMAADDGITRLGLADPDEPARERSGRRVDATLHELGALAQYFLVGGPSLGRSPWRPIVARRTDFPLGDEGLAPYTVPKPARCRAPRPRRHHPPLPIRALAPAQRKGAREAGRGSIVRRSDRL